MIRVSDMSANLVPGRLYLVLTERELPAYKAGEFSGDFRFVLWDKSLGVYVYRFELERPWKVLDAYVHFFKALGYTGNEAVFSDGSRWPVVIVDAEGERAFYDSISGMIGAYTDLGLGFFDDGTKVLELARDVGRGMVNAADTTSKILAWAPVVLGVVLLIGVAVVARRAA